MIVSSLAKSIKNDSTKLSKTLIFIRTKQSTSSLTSFLIYYKLVILGTLDMPGYGDQQCYYQLAENFHVHLHVKILQNCYYGHFEHVWPHPPSTMVSPCRKLMLICIQTFNLIPNFFLEILHCKEYCN